jgi:hypothetical protein
MNLQLSKNFAVRTGLALAMALAVWSPASSQSPEPAKAKKMPMEDKAMKGKAMEGKPMEHSKMMMDRCQAMMTEMKAQDAELATQIAAMNSATPEAKVELMAAILTKMAQQRTAMNTQMADMHMGMMQHMQMGKGSMSQPSMMKSMDKKPE